MQEYVQRIAAVYLAYSEKIPQPWCGERDLPSIIPLQKFKLLVSVSSH